MAAVTRWLTAPVPLGRVAAFRTLVYVFVIADVLFFTHWVRAHAAIPGELYQPLLVGRLLPLPTPTAALVYGVFAGLLVTAAVAATGRWPRLTGALVAVLYFQWMIIAMSYGKVDHDRFAFLIALAVLPTIGRARHGDRTRSEATGWALRVVQLAVIATYFLAAWAKLRYGGLEWITSATLTWAIIRRGTFLAELLLALPWLLILAQLGIVLFELLSPLVFVLRERWQLRVVGFFYSFHLVTFAMITISFLPHLVAMASFLPLERVRPVVRTRAWLRRRRGAATPLGAGQHAGGGAAGHAVPVAGDQPVRRPGEAEHGPPREESA
ncbi:MFS transporter permease [Natronosporangium hydrolyticum]|uniref:MFS transporter permease n=1 Tax=Natronosporangium hydrolyticum TaxID=2811111 RepID=UPI00308409E4